ncbi:protein phosphatase 2C domain-containing protein [Actinomadura luteofluorescens]|uniref:protein phosphatase 2C domain-containing protein n=1 Tax=Actinomadura luteofluorescens TaxID=46163 RepID=UPI00362BABE3
MNADQHTPVALCRTCGEPVNERDRFCEECGRPDPTTPRTPPLGTALPHASPTPASRAAPFAPNPVPRQREQPPSAPQADPGEGTAAGGACVDCGVGAVGADGYCEQCGLRQPSGREHVEAEAGRSGAAVSDLGLRRSRNEDAFALAELPAGVCAVVCDGVATAPGSEEASRLAAEAALAVLTGRVPAAPTRGARCATRRRGRARSWRGCPAIPTPRRRARSCRPSWTRAASPSAGSATAAPTGSRRRARAGSPRTTRGPRP